MIIHYMSFPFPCLMAILIILGIITARIKYVSRKEEEQKDNFWEIEADANSTPRQDISKLDYIKIPDEILDFCELTDSEILSGARLTLDDLKEKKILNLSAYTNTELKKKYGAANLNILAECDENFILLIRCLQNMAFELKEKGFDMQAKQTLEYAVSIRSDISESYRQLGLLYIKEGKRDDLSRLQRQASSLDSPMRKKILESLQRIG